MAICMKWNPEHKAGSITSELNEPDMVTGRCAQTSCSSWKYAIGLPFFEVVVHLWMAGVGIRWGMSGILLLLTWNQVINSIVLCTIAVGPFSRSFSGPAGLGRPGRAFKMVMRLSLGSLAFVRGIVGIIEGPIFMYELLPTSHCGRRT